MKFSYLFTSTFLIIHNCLYSQDLANYGTPSHSIINNTVGTIVQDQSSPAKREMLDDKQKKSRR